MNRRMLLVWLGAVMIGGPAAQAEDRVYQPPSWRVPPNPNLAAELMPPFASLTGISGWATVKCLVMEDGHPFRCEVAEERPAGLGFGSAARVVVASGEIEAARSDGHLVNRWVRTTVRFTAFGLEEFVPPWTGPEPSPENLALARRVVETDPIYEPATIEDVLVGLDADRRPVIRGWIEEILPGYLQSVEDAPVIQLARVATPDQLRTILEGGGYMPTFDDDLWEQALPDISPQELPSVRELRRRYCERWGCELEP